MGGWGLGGWMDGGMGFGGTGGWRDGGMGDVGMEGCGDGGMEGWGAKTDECSVLFEMPGQILHSVGGNNRATMQRD